MYNFNIDKIASYISVYKEQLEHLYNWTPNLNKLSDIISLSDQEKNSLFSSDLSNFEKDEILKNILHKNLNNVNQESELFNKISLWIIREWGGIYGGSDENTIKNVSEFFQTDKPKFNRIASSSKVGAFKYPNKKIIYDSRVAYSMNWILLSQNASKVFFPIPEGRNTKMNAFDLNVLIRLYHINQYSLPNINILKKDKKYIASKDKLIFIPKSIAYYEMNNLIREVNNILWKNQRKNEPFYTERLLFAIADNVIFNDITKKIKIKINKC